MKIILMLQSVGLSKTKNRILVKTLVLTVVRTWPNKFLAAATRGVL